MKNFDTDHEERLFLARLSDAAQLAGKRNSPVYTDFLTPAQQRIARDKTNSVKHLQFCLWGGFEDAERKMGAFYPEGREPSEWPICTLALKTRGEYPSHPEILGSLTGLGIRREKVGDIITSVEPPLLICEKTVAPFLLENFTKAGRKAFKPEISEICQVPEATYEETTFTVPSLRLDCIAAEGFRIARTKMTEQIKKGQVNLNWKETLSPAAAVAEDDTISVRGFGRLVVSEIGGTSKKDRIFITVKRYARK